MTEDLQARVDVLEGIIERLEELMVEAVPLPELPKEYAGLA